jgi:hypothetical protein
MSDFREADAARVHGSLTRKATLDIAKIIFERLRIFWAESRLDPWSTDSKSFAIPSAWSSKVGNGPGLE